MTAAAALLPGGRLHLQHGPIDLVIGVEGARAPAYRAAQHCFAGLLQGLVDELPQLRQPVGPVLHGPVARRMRAACLPYAPTRFVTPMAAVAGAVADQVLQAMRAQSAPITRAYVNNGGDIALYLAPGGRFDVAVAGLDGAGLGRIALRAEMGVGGIATSGRGGRSGAAQVNPLSRSLGLTQHLEFFRVKRKDLILPDFWVYVLTAQVTTEYIQLANVVRIGLNPPTRSI
ncbi:MAG: UPF0280 family protein [Rhodobacteraceae bacterium]|nr:UPF0280 family protein [Paracoccaceae bacterium]